MKDAYSFERDEESLDTTYKTMAEAYHNIFESCGLDFRMVEADNGSIGGSSSAEFMVLADTGEDTIMECKRANYAANVEVHKDADFQEKHPDIPLSELRETKGIEVGHIFKLGTTYSEQMKATFVDQDGQSKPFQMGCYGIGVSRTVAAAIEQNHDEKGIKWPKALSPYEVIIIVTNIKKEELMGPAESLYTTLIEKGVDVIIDDRSESAGVKFKDADLIGFSTQVVFGKSWSEHQEVEMKDRMSGDSKRCTIEEVVNELLGR
jgi:prolyl-tRNA synthetase